jgi:hypothetical protein
MRWQVIRETMWLRFKPGIGLQSVTFDSGYDRAALQSYDIFSRLRGEGAIPNHIPFHVSLPTPMGSRYMQVSPKAREARPRGFAKPQSKSCNELSDYHSGVRAPGPRPALCLQIRYRFASNAALVVRKFISNSRLVVPKYQRATDSNWN